MTESLSELRTTLVTLHQAGIKVGLPPNRADTLIRLLGEGESPVAAAQGAGLDSRVAAAASGLDGDVPAVLGRLATMLADADDAARRLRAAAVYPLWLAATVLLCAWAVGARALPALRTTELAEVPPGSFAATFGLALAVALLVVLGALVGGRVRVPWLGQGWGLLEGYAFLHGVAILSAGGTSLDQAVARSGGFTRKGAARRAASSLAHALASGTAPGDVRPLLHPFEVSMLAAATASGAEVDTAAAIAEQRRIALARVIPDSVVRIQATALIVGGGAVLILGVTLFGSYVDAIGL